MDDTYMRGFADRCRQESKPEAHDSSDDESVHVPPAPPVQETFSVFVANVPFAVSEAQVRAVCAETGDLVDFDLPLCRAGANAGRPAGYAISAYASRDAAERAVEALDGRDFLGRELRAKLDEEGTTTNGRASPPSTRRKPPRSGRATLTTGPTARGRRASRISCGASSAPRTRIWRRPARTSFVGGAAGRATSRGTAGTRRGRCRSSARRAAPWATRGSGARPATARRVYLMERRAWSVVGRDI